MTTTCYGHFLSMYKTKATGFRWGGTGGFNMAALWNE